MAMFIAVRSSQQNASPWIAMLWDRTEAGLRSETQYSGTRTRSFPRSSGDTKIGTHSYTDTNTGNQTILHLYELSGAVSLREGFRRNDI